MPMLCFGKTAPCISWEAVFVIQFILNPSTLSVPLGTGYSLWFLCLLRLQHAAMHAGYMTAYILFTCMLMHGTTAYFSLLYMFGKWLFSDDNFHLKLTATNLWNPKGNNLWCSWQCDADETCCFNGSAILAQQRWKGLFFSDFQLVQ